MVCEFAEPSIDGRKPICQKCIALKEILTGGNLEGVFTLSELMEEICKNPNAQAREQCPAYTDIKKSGRSSKYCK